MTIKIDVYMEDGRDYYVVTYKHVTFIEIRTLAKDYFILRILLRFYFKLINANPNAMTPRGLKIAYLNKNEKAQLKFALKRIYRSTISHIESRSVKDMLKLSNNDLDSILYKIIDLENYLILVTCS